MEMPELKLRHAVIPALLLMLTFAFFQVGIASITATENMEMGDANCSIALTVIGLKDGEPVTTPLYNSPLYFQGVEVDSLQFDITITATGANVDWSTFYTKFVISAETFQASGLETWSVAAGDYVLQDDGSYVAHGSYLIDEHLTDLPYTTPDEILPDGTKVWYYDIEAVVDGWIEELATGAQIHAEVTVGMTFELHSLPSGELNLVVD